MATVNTSASVALASLQLLKPPAQANALAKAQLPQASPTGARPRVSAELFDALTKLAETACGATKLADLAADHAERLQAFGADAAMRVPKPVVSDAEFQSIVTSYITESWTGLEGLAEALAGGTVKIQRAGDVVGLGYETIQYNMFKNGGQIGGAGWDTINRGFYDAQAASGIRQGIGSINGLDYYVTW